MRNFWKQESYEILPAHDGPRRYLARAHCYKCNEQIDIPVTGVSPHVVKTYFTRAGWQFDGNSRSGCICPKCRGGKPKMKNTPDLKIVPPPADTSAAALTAGNDLVARLNSEQRRKVRKLLDEFFDDDKGMYLNDYTDKRIGDETDVPALAVTQLREQAYGLIQDDERLAALRTKIKACEALLAKQRAKDDGMQRALEAHQAKSRDFEVEVRSIITGLHKELEALRSKL